MPIADWLDTELAGLLLRQWVGLAGLVAAGLLAGTVAQWIALSVAGAITRRTRSRWDDGFVRLFAGPTRYFVFLFLVWSFLPALRLPADAEHAVLVAIRVLLIVAFLWFALRAITIAAALIETYLSRGVTDPSRLRSIRTQVALPRRILHFTAIVVGTALIFLQFDVVRTVGLSLIASAGIAGLVIGLAAQRIIGNILAGIQVAIAQPLRIEDAVLVENEFGVVEEIGLTYVVVRLWDQRRMILPVSYFLDRPFQNWTRSTSELMGTVFLHADYTVPVEEARQELKRIVEASPLWDRRAQGLQVTELLPASVQLRALVSAANAAALWDLRCEVREKLLAWLQARRAQFVPVQRFERLGPA